jgi:Rieske Fe-S protein
MTDRRNVLKVIAGTASATAVGAAALPALGLVAAPAAPKAQRAAGHGVTAASPLGADWTIVARFEDLAQNQPLQVPVMGSEEDAWSVTPNRRVGAVWLLRDGEAPASLRAFSAVCPHLGCLIEQVPDGFSCPCHTTAFNRQGERLSGAAPRGMDPIEVRVVEGMVNVRYKKFRLGVPERLPAG